MRLEVKDSYSINGNPVFSVENPETCERKELSKFVGQPFEVEDKNYTIIGVESFALNTIKKGSPIAFMCVGSRED